MRGKSQRCGHAVSVDGHFEQAKRIEAQIATSLPKRKRLWAAIVRSKLEQQASALQAIGAPSVPLSALLKKVKSGDPQNVEAQGARRYWGLLFGETFRRDKNSSGVNALLNYGYTVLRACTARAVVAAGLHPSIGLHHSNDTNAMRLVDDIMEPFRPTIDLRVWALHQKNEGHVTSETKRAMVLTLYDDLQSDAGATPVITSVQRLATSLAQCYLGERDRLDLPLPGLPIAMATALRCDGG